MLVPSPGSHRAVRALLVLLFALGANGLAGAEEAPATLQARIDREVLRVREWAREPVLVHAVEAHNGALTSEEAAMTQERWQALPILDPFPRAFVQNPAAQFLRSVRTDLVSEAFVSGADGRKVAFLAKPSNWSHAGKPKHEVPMTGRSWQGPVEEDASTGLRQLQVAVPVLAGGRAVGSLVVGLSVTKLAAAPQ